jgi:hypothetical protein
MGEASDRVLQRVEHRIASGSLGQRCLEHMVHIQHRPED